MPDYAPQPHSILSLKQAAGAGAVKAVVHCQISRLASKLTRGGKPYLEMSLADSSGQMVIRVWSDHACYGEISSMGQGTFVSITGEFENTEYGMDAKSWSVMALKDDEIEGVLAGDPELRAVQERDYDTIGSLVASLADPRLKRACEIFLESYGEKFRRTAAARGYHHARRGGLVEHVAQMMRSADALCGVYPQLNRDLLLAGCLFHDCGKLFENCMEERGFEMPYTKMGELLGHIPSGIEFANSIWHKALAEVEGAERMRPPSKDTHLHLLHLIAAHHGEHEFGSPTLPRIPEAVALHYIDNLDAKLEMFAAGYRTSPLLAPGIHERVRPLPAALVAQLPRYREEGVEQSD